MDDERKYIYTNINANNNKWWTVQRYGNKVKSLFGRVGEKGSTQEWVLENDTKAIKYVETKCREKENKGYTKLQVIDNKITPSNISLSDVVKQQISGNFGNLIDLLIEKNVHNILSDTTLKYNATTGLFSTPLGVVTSSSISEARDILAKLTFPGYDTNLVNKYLMLVPSDIGRNRLNATQIVTEKFLKKQFEILDSLESSIKILETSVITDTSEIAKVFNTNINLVTDPAIINYISNKFISTRKNMHSSSYLNVKTVYEIEITKVKENYLKCPVDNVMELWHGTGVANILSILKTGLKKSPPSTARIAGKAFGNGIYASDQSSKSLNYSTGFWTGSSSQNFFMFLLDVKMGNPYYPTHTGDYEPYMKKGYNSVYAKPGDGFVRSLMNNEMIVFDESQINIKYLIEFS